MLTYWLMFLLPALAVLFARAEEVFLLEAGTTVGRPGEDVVGSFHFLPCDVQRTPPSSAPSTTSCSIASNAASSSAGLSCGRLGS